MDKNAKIFIAGHKGLVGSATVKKLQESGYSNLLLRTRQALDLTDQIQVAQFFDAERPEYVVLAAAKVGGIYANNTYPAEFIHQNLLIQNNVIHQAYLHGVKRLIFLGSSCIYPKACDQPIKEEYLLTGPLEPTNRPYALAKIAGIEMCSAYNRQYGTKFIAVMPTNLYGPGDNYHPENSHVIPGLINKIHHAKEQGEPSVSLWGTGKPKREFLYSEDLGDALVFLLNLDKRFDDLAAQPFPLINVGTGTDVTILELAHLLKETIGYDGEFHFDSTKPDGTMRKVMDVSKIAALGWEAKVTLTAGLKLAYEDYNQLETA